MTQGEADIRRVFESRAKAFIPFLIVGDPSKVLSRRIISAVAEHADILEIGLPYSDPLADGPINQRGSQRALAAASLGLPDVLAEAGWLRRQGLKKPLVLLTYANPLLQRLDRLPKKGRCPLSAVVIPDLPEDEAPRLRRRLNQAGMALVNMAAPTTPPARLKRIALASQGFVYLVSVTGVTGLRKSLPPEIPARVAALRKVCRLPVALGFGVSNPAMAAKVAGICDGVVVGSAMVNEVEKNLARGSSIHARVGRFAAKLAYAVHGVAR